MRLLLLDQHFSVCRLSSDSPIPDWAYQSSFFNICKTDEELSIVAETKYCPEQITTESNWRALKVQGPLDFNLTGILASLTQPLADAGISIFAISTYDTDYILLKETCLEKTKAVLTQAGHSFLD